MRVARDGYGAKAPPLAARPCVVPTCGETGGCFGCVMPNFPRLFGYRALSCSFLLSLSLDVSVTLSDFLLLCFFCCPLSLPLSFAFSFIFPLCLPITHKSQVGDHDSILRYGGLDSLLSALKAHGKDARLRLGVFIGH